ncbi:MAG: restriction endonuclease [Armatimonadetes bacterium]|nr:restriction endonuclease [Armatimonadota bacterium]
MSDQAALAALRREYHDAICRSLLTRDAEYGHWSNADKSSPLSRALAESVANRMGAAVGTATASAQTKGANFAALTLRYLKASFALLDHLRPGAWQWTCAQGRAKTSRYLQYSHLGDVEEHLLQHTSMRANWGADYTVAPDVVVYRHQLHDSEIETSDAENPLLTPDIATHTDLRAQPHAVAQPVMHASISCKWTMRSDRAQNSRTEALNLIRARKGRVPHIVVVTFEPLPSRIGSIAFGTGDVDCTYHTALYELEAAVRERGDESAQELMQTMVEGRRLRDISDLPLDLAL